MGFNQVVVSTLHQEEKRVKTEELRRLPKDLLEERLLIQIGKNVLPSWNTVQVNSNSQVTTGQVVHLEEWGYEKKGLWLSWVNQHLKEVKQFWMVMKKW
jgi:hypothetical protein